MYVDFLICLSHCNQGKKAIGKENNIEKSGLRQNIADMWQSLALRVEVEKGKGEILLFLAANGSIF